MLIYSPLCSSCWSATNDGNDLAPFSVGHDKETATPGFSNVNEAIFRFGMLVIEDGYGKWILKYRRRCFKTDAMLLLVRECFRRVPFKPCTHTDPIVLIVRLIVPTTTERALR